MLKLTWIEFFMRAIPEAFITVFGIYIIAKHEIIKSRYILCSISVALVAYFVRFLPIHIGINIIINNVFIICVVMIAGIPLLRAIYSTIFTMLLLLIGELINTILFDIFSINIEIAFKNAFTKCMLEIPSLIFLILAILFIYFLFNKKEAVKNEIN
ncbi:MAG: hypothetical protein ACERKV_13775 [Clostridiaceae bacterium]